MRKWFDDLVVFLRLAEFLNFYMMTNPERGGDKFCRRLKKVGL